jgi:hypothetical protein
MKIIKCEDVYCDEANGRFYTIDEFGNIEWNGNPDDAPKKVWYNDILYVKLRSISKQPRIYRVDRLIVETFLPDEIVRRAFTAYDGSKHYRIEFINGNRHDITLTNLRVVMFIEKWLPCTFPGVKQGMYAVSNLGNVRNLVKNFICKQHKEVSYEGGKEYRRVSLMSADDRFHEYRTHRLVGWEFLPHENNVDLFTSLEVNHIDGDTSNNRIDNLELCNNKDNVSHAYKTGLSSNIGTNHYNHKISEYDAKLICELLLKYNGFARYVVHEISKQKPYINNRIVNKIKHKTSWKHISDKYFQKDFFTGNAHNTRYSENDIRNVCRTLIECDGSPKDTRDIIMDRYGIKMDNNYIGEIKLKKKWKAISDEYFTIDGYTVIPIKQ